MEKLFLLSVLFFFLKCINLNAQLAQITNCEFNEYHPKWSPDGSIIAYTKRTKQDVSIWLNPVSGGSSEKINIDKTGDLAFCWSPEGTKIVFDAYPSSNLPADLYIVDIASGNIQQLTNYQASENHPVWSEDGSKIAFTWSGEIWSISTVGDALTQITSGHNDWHPCWSPDGSTIAFTSDRSGNMDIWTIPSIGGEPTQLTSNPADDDRACWSPDGSMIAFGSKRSGNMDIWLLSIRDGTTEQLTSHNAYDSHADWSPDGSKIAFASQRNGNFDVFIIKVPATK